MPADCEVDVGAVCSFQMSTYSFTLKPTYSLFLSNPISFYSKGQETLEDTTWGFRASVEEMELRIRRYPSYRWSL